MFHAVRHWWGSGRGKVTARLFAFEFLVVVAGVLTAQGLANWVSDRAEQRAIGEEDKRVRYEIGRARQVARIWSAATPCLVARVESIARHAAAADPVDTKELRVPQFIGYTVEPFSPDMNREFHDRFGNDRVDNYAVVITGTGGLVDSYRAVRRGWDRFALLDPSLGATSPADRATVRDVAVQVRSQLDQIRASAAMVEATAARLGIAPITSGADFGSAGPVGGCNEIWQTGRIWRDAPANNR
ncbi:hypothetical protein [Sphingomonas flavescens]|uniref:hypothetical protein n=1 Tax=Sphingomonas flavescens TaxID=3132797 RepID=UPI0028065193|nr:hypothetical protein [Sphingomonas limnosediminicola]